MLRSSSPPRSPGSGRGSPSTTTHYRVSDETQTDVGSTADPTARLVQVAFLQLVLASRRSIEQAREDDLGVLECVESSMRGCALQYERSAAVLVDDAMRGASHLLNIEAERFAFVTQWELSERRVRHLNEERAVAADATLRLATSIRQQQRSPSQ